MDFRKFDFEAGESTGAFCRHCPSTSDGRAAEIIGYAPHTVLSYVRQKRIFAVWISGKYILPKTAIVDLLIGDFALEIVHKSMWHMNTILLFVEKE